MKQAPQSSSSDWHKGLANSNSANHKLISKRSILIGALVLLAVLALASGGAALNNDDSNKSGSLKSVTTGSVTNDTPASVGSEASSNVTEGVSTSVNSQTIDGSTQTQVTVNGQSVPVPANGSAQHTVGNTSVYIQSTRNNSGTSVQVDSSAANFDSEADE